MPSGLESSPAKGIIQDNQIICMILKAWVSMVPIVTGYPSIEG